ncbi:MAG: hypothetical protein HRU28_15210 [Rhizobiales bacterium]|nr:hypothetical protein [Hyphomicrobiales bacterium]
MSDPTKDKIYTLPPKGKLTSTTPPKVSLDEVLVELENWRANKPSPTASIPDSLWHKIFALAKIHTETKIRSLLSISTKQYNSKYAQLFSPKATSTASNAKIDLCQIKTPAPEKAVYQPLKIPASNTIVAEFYRPDGCIMKIHTTTESFSSLINAFFEAVKDVTVNVQA